MFKGTRNFSLTTSIELWGKSTYVLEYAILFTCISLTVPTEFLIIV